MTVDPNVHADEAPQYGQRFRKYGMKPIAWLCSRNWVWKRKACASPEETVIAGLPNVPDLGIPGGFVNLAPIRKNLPSIEKLSAGATSESSNPPKMKYGTTDFGLLVESIDFSAPLPNSGAFDDPDPEELKHCHSSILASSNKATSSDSLAEVTLASSDPSIISNQAEIGDSDADQITNVVETEKKEAGPAEKKRGFLDPLWQKFLPNRPKMLMNEEDDASGDLASELFVLYDDEAEANFNIFITSIRSVLNGNIEQYKGPKEMKLIRSDKSSSNSKKRSSVSTGFTRRTSLV